MKDLKKYSQLWQQKRGELNVNADAGADWSQMNNLLNRTMPVTPTVGPSNIAKVFKTGPITGFIAGTAVIVYLTAHLIGLKPKPQKAGHHKNMRDTTTVITAAEIQQADNGADSAQLAQQQLINADSSVNSASPELSGTNATINQTVTKAAGQPTIIGNQITNNHVSDAPAVGGKSGASSINHNAAAENSLAGKQVSNSSINHTVNNNAAVAKAKTNNKTAAIFTTMNNAINGVGNVSGSLSGNGRNEKYLGRSALNRRLSNQSTYADLHTSRKNNRGSHHGMKNGKGATSSNIKNANTAQAQVNKLMGGRGRGDRNSFEQNNADNDSLLIPGKMQSTIYLTTQTRYNSRSNAMLPNAGPPYYLAGNGLSSNKKSKDKKAKSSKDSTGFFSKLDWGLLAGVSTGGSFTDKSQNKNFYGSLPVDAYVGLYGIYLLTNKWGVNLQVRGLTPQTINGGYTHANGSKVDSGKVIQVSDNRKAWFVTIPVHAVYQITDNISIKAGPVINLPVRQLNISNTLTPTTINKDSVYYAKTIKQIKAATYQQKIDLGFSGGINLQLGRLGIEAVYLKSFGGYNVISDYGTYKANGGSVQITVGFRLNRAR